MDTATLMYVRFAYFHILSNNSFDSWPRLPKQKCKIATKSIALTFATCLPALDAISSHHPLRLAMTRVS